MSFNRTIRLTGVRQNNLKNISVEFPSGKLTVVTGLSGSGKSSLAFNTLYAEGQRRYIESLSPYTRQFLNKMPKPDLDSIENIPPSIALEQKNSVIHSRSTVGTQTEIADYLRILFSKIGQTYCQDCGHEVKAFTSQSLLEWAKVWLPHRGALILAPLSKNSVYKKTSDFFEALTPFLQKQGFQRILIKSPNKLPEMFELDELPHKKIKNNKETLFYVVVDRLKLINTSSAEDSETQNRILNSIEQALSIGQGNLVFFDLSEATPISENWKPFNLKFSCIQCAKEHRIPEPQLFSFNNPLGACSECSGFGYTLNLDESLVVPDPTKTLKNGAIDPFSKPSLVNWQKSLFHFVEQYGISIGKRYQDLNAEEKNLIWNGDPKNPKFPGIFACFEKLKRWKYKIYIRVFMRRYQSQKLCTRCKGSRLNPEALLVKIKEHSFFDLLSLPIENLLEWILHLCLTPEEEKIGNEALQQIRKRLSFLKEVGLGYLKLSRLTKTLSGGESQRINLATQLGNGLCGTLYILDEPSIGLHANDTEKLIYILKRLRDQGNTVVVVEHDLEIMKAADWLIELGPAAGYKGGELLAQGSAADLILCAGSLTGKYLSGDFFLKRQHPPRKSSKKTLKLQGCKENNLQNLTIEFPLNQLVVVTGVSGSGKSTLVHQTLYNALSQFFDKTQEPVGRLEKLHGTEYLSGVVLLNQNSIGKSSRSNPLTYLKAWDEIRRIYALQPLSVKRGYKSSYFSFNIDGGRCPECKGEGEVTLDMHFMADIKLPCEECEGKKFKKNILDITYREKNIDQLLHTTIDEAFSLFHEQPSLTHKLRLLQEVGLGYLQLGQSLTTLSGGESQRLKIAATLANRSRQNLLYIFDEPTTGLHLEDIKKFIGVIQGLVEAKQSVILIEHHLDIIYQADWIIDLGPGGGKQGGCLVSEGPPRTIMMNKDSPTGQALKRQNYSLPKAKE